MAIADLIKIPTVQAFLMDGAVMTVFEAILEKFALEKERAIELLDLTDAVLEGTLELKDVPALLQQAFAIEDARSVRMACDVVGFRLLPLEEYVPGVVEQIKAWGGDLNKYPKSRVGKLRMTPETFAASLDEKLGFDFSEVLIKRCGFLLHAYWKGEKTKESTLTFFSRASSIGGLGLSPENAQILLESIDRERDMVELVDDVSGVVINTSEQALAEMEKESENLGHDGDGAEAPRVPEKFDAQDEPEVNHGVEKIEAPEAATPVLESKEIEAAPSHAVAAEVPVVSAPESHPELVEGAKTARRMTVLDESSDAIDALVTRSVNDSRSILVECKIPEDVFAEIVRKALKGVRDLFQTRSILERDFKCSGENLEKLTEIIEGVHGEMHASKSSSVMVGRSDANDVVSASSATELIDESVLDKRFAALTKSVPGKVEQEVLPGSRTSLLRSSEEEHGAQIAAIPPEKLVEAEIARRPAAVTPMLTVGSIAPAKKEGLLTDIQPVRRLVGPVEELANMSAGEFRRLSATPADAAQKVEDILATLEMQSFEDRVKGIQAWRQSPMNQLYTTMMSEALVQGVALAEVASKRRSALEESLSPAEIRAVAALNERLRF